MEELKTKLEEYVVFCRVDKGLRKSTSEMRKRIMSKFLRESNTLQPDSTLFRKYVLDMYDRKLTRSAIHNFIVSAEAYYEFMKIPIITISRPKKDHKIVGETLSEAEIAMIFVSCRNSREKAMLSVLAYSGIRCEELCNLKVLDIDFGKGLIKVSGKGGRDGVSFISGDCINLLMDYLSEYPRKSQDYLFTTIRFGMRMSPTSIRRLVKKLGKRAHIKKRVYPHLFRHSLASNMLDRGANPITIQEQLRHRHLTTTMIYAHSRKQRVEAEYRLFSPKYI